MLTSNRFSAETQNALRFADLEEQIEEHPEEAIARVHRLLIEYVQRGEPVSRRVLIARISGSIDNMSPDSEFLAKLVATPVTPRIESHSIIAVRGNPSLEDPDEREDASDGVVKFESAQVDGVFSQLIVQSAHTCLQHPWTIAELRRIFLSHIGETRRGPAELNLP